MTTRRAFLQSASVAAGAMSLPSFASEEPSGLLEEFGYRDVALAPGLPQTQFEQTQAVLLSLNEDSLLKPWRLRAGLPAPGPDLGGWYDELPLHKTESGGHGFAPAHSFGQWISALARGYAASGDAAVRAKLEKLLTLYEPAISGRFYQNFRFPAYNYDKMVIGLIDAHRFGDMPQAYRLLAKTTAAAEQHLPPHALDRDEPQRKWRKSVGENTGNDYTWDESYTLPENLYLAWSRGAGERYKTLAGRFLLDRTYFDPLSEGKNVLANHHAYSFCNALSSAMQAYISAGSRKHLRAAANAFEMINDSQSFATGGWGPNESFVAPESDALYASLTSTHRGFETPCGSYAHFKLTRYLLRVTRDGRYGDSMERVLYNTVLGAKPLQPDGRAFYYSDYNRNAKKSYFPDAWPCCSGTLPQVAADYRILMYFRDEAGVFVNLYLPSTLRWITNDGAQASLVQTGNYPLQPDVALRLRTSRPSRFTLRLRIPGWSAAADPFSVKVNGEPAPAQVQKGFLQLQREWNDGDRIELSLPLPLRLEPVDPGHPQTVALVRGPLVLFPVSDIPATLTRDHILAVEKIPHEAAWKAKAKGGDVKFLPFFAIAGESYRQYVDVA